ncbi:MAG: hypothetical protein QNK11_09570 [Legionella sp.]|nr:hypothetical protein [Legionella sp.]
MKKILMGLLFLSSINAFAEQAATLAWGGLLSNQREKLPITKSYSGKEISLSTANIPSKMRVLVFCKVELEDSYYANRQFVFNVYPRSNDYGKSEFGKIEERFYFNDGTNLIREIGSKIYTNHHRSPDKKTTVFYINQVSRKNEAIIINLGNLPKGTDVSCEF